MRPDAAPSVVRLGIMTGGGAAGGALLPAATFALCVLPLATHWSPGVAGYLWVGIVMSLALGGATAGVSGVDPRSPRVWPLLATTAPFAAVLAWGVCTLLWSATPSRSIALIALLLAGLAAVLPLLTVVRLPDVQVAPVLRAVAAAAVLGTLG